MHFFPGSRARSWSPQPGARPFLRHDTSRPLSTRIFPPRQTMSDCEKEARYGPDCRWSPPRDHCRPRESIFRRAASSVARSFSKGARRAVKDAAVEVVRRTAPSGGEAGREHSAFAEDEAAGEEGFVTRDRGDHHPTEISYIYTFFAHVMLYMHDHHVAYTGSIRIRCITHKHVRRVTKSGEFLWKSYGSSVLI